MIKVAVLKPHHGPVGGFERVVARVETILEDAGYDVTRYSIDMTRALAAPMIDGPLDATGRELATYLYGRDRFDGLATSVYDLVVSTSPPSYVHRHPRHLALFYHHHRVFYDLEDLYVAAGFADDPERHRAAANRVRTLDADRLDDVTTFLCPSLTVAGRLARFNGRDHTLPFHAGIGVDGAEPPAPTADTRGVLCVTRHEFPKRTELLVAAAHLVAPTVPVVCTGTGGRLAFNRHLDAALADRVITVDELQASSTWCNTGQVSGPPASGDGRVEFVGHVPDAELDHLYATARCVIAPAYDEDYGLTAIEAMAHGRPVIVCSDGGGLAELVADGETGLVVDPTPHAIADAITRLHEDTDLATELGRNGRERAGELSWAAARDQLLVAAEATLDQVTSPR